jgi:hypothetical protein
MLDTELYKKLPFFLGVTLVLSTTVSTQPKFVSSRFAGNESVQALAYGSNIARIVNSLTVDDCSAFCLAGECQKQITLIQRNIAPIVSLRTLLDDQYPVSCYFSYQLLSTRQSRADRSNWSKRQKHQTGAGVS